MIYLIHGDEEFLRAEALAEIKTALGPPEFAQLNTTELDGSRFTMADLRHACEAMPFLAPRRLVILNAGLTAFARKAQRSQGKGRGQADAGAGRDAEDAGGEALPAALKELRGALIAYLARIPESTDLVLLEPALVRKIDPAFKALESAALAPRVRILLCQYAGEWWKQDEWLLSWLVQRARQRKIKLEAAAAQALTELAGHNLRLLDQELSKLATYTANARAISAADVRLLVSAARERSVFEMVEALAGGNGKQAATLLQGLLAAGEQPLGILGMIAWQFRLLLQVKELMDEGKDQEAAGAILGQKPYTMKKAWPQAQRLNLATLEWAMERLLETDIAIKTGQMEDQLALTVLVAELSQRR